MLPIKTTIDDGQGYVDEPIVVHPEPIAKDISAIFISQKKQPIIIGYNRIRLRWMKPGKDGLIPK